MKSQKLLTRTLENREELVYQLISSEAICLREEERETAYSVLVAHTDGEAVLESALVYDVSRMEEKGRVLMMRLWENGTEPKNVKDVVSELL